MKRVAEQIADWVAAQGVEQVFAVTGGGAMFLNHALGLHPKLNCTFMHHEQACAMAAEGYARVCGKMAIVNVTTGPGGINALNGVFGAFTDSIPMLVLSGQVKRETCLEYTPVPGLRQLGDQEAPIVAMAKPITKAAIAITSLAQLGSALPEAFHLANHGRPGPVWLDIPIDIQSAQELVTFSPLPDDAPGKQDDLATPSAMVIDLLKSANRPLLLAGTGVRLAHAEGALLAFAEKHGIPVATAWTHDLIASDHPLFAGRPGTIGTRAGNFSLQNADLVIVLGSRLNIRQVSYNWQSFAARAKLVQVDIDPCELDKPMVKANLAIRADVGDFLSALHCMLPERTLPDYSTWAGWCKSLHTRFPVLQAHHLLSPIMNPYAVVNYVFEHLRDDDIVVCGNASACILPFQVGKLRAGQRLFSNSGSASMGYDLPAAIGAAVGGAGRRVICFAGDGSLQMNIQELQTVRTHGLDLLILVLENGGYLSIKQTHENFFGQVVGANAASGVDFPDFQRIAAAYGLPASTVSNEFELGKLAEALAGSGPQLVQIHVDPEQTFEPRIKSRIGDDGKFQTPELDDMFPFLPAAELNAIRAEATAITALRR